MEDGATAAAAADAVSKVLGDDLLIEILLRLGFPTTLVRAAAVCKRWLHHVADKAFLRRFRKLNPPRPLGFYIEASQASPRFVPLLPQPPELAAAARLVQDHALGADNESVLVRDSRNGTVLTFQCSSGRRPSLGVHSPLCPERTISIDPPPSPLHRHPFTLPIPAEESFHLLSRDEKGGGLSYFYVSTEFVGRLDLTTLFIARVSMLQDGVWCMRASAARQLTHWLGGAQAVMAGNKIYMMLAPEDITVLDLTTSSFSTMQPPQGVPYSDSEFMLAPADDASSVYLVEAKEFQLRVWLHKGDSWSAVDTVSLHEMCANLMVSDCTVKDAHTSDLRIKHVGDNAEFVLLQMGPFLRYLDMRCKTLCTVYEMSEDEQESGSFSIQPFMMIWPPTFPALNCDPTRNSHVKKEDIRKPLDGIYVGEDGGIMQDQ